MDFDEKPDRLAARLRKLADVVLNPYGSQLHLSMDDYYRKSSILGISPKLIELIHRLFSYLNVNYAIIGGIAATYHARPRMTKDLDVTVDESIIAVQDKLKDPEFMMKFGFGAIKSTISRHRFHIKSEDYGLVEAVPAVTPMLKAALKDAMARSAQPGAYPVVSPKYFILLKVDAFKNSPARFDKDAFDAASTVMRKKVDIDALIDQYPNFARELKKIKTIVELKAK